LSASEPKSTLKSKMDDERARDHLANERTYLAWIRTAISLMGMGIVISKLKYLVSSNFPEATGIVQVAHIGWLFTAVGVVTVALAVIYFLQTQKQIREATYQSRTLLVIILAGMTGALGLAILWYLTKPTVPVNTVAPTNINIIEKAN
jgi:putative membrane protein